MALICAAMHRNVPRAFTCIAASNALGSRSARGRGSAAAGVIKRSVNAAVSLDGTRHDALHVVDLRDIGLDRERLTALGGDLGRQGFELLYASGR